MKKSRYLLSITVLSIAFLISGSAAFAAMEIPPDISLTIPGPNAPSAGVPGMVANIYQFSLMIAVLLAFAMIVFAGAKYMFARGNPGQQSDAKDGITQALLGLLLLAGASILLNTINPRLTNLFLPTLDQIQAPTSTPGGPAGNPAAETAARLALNPVAIAGNRVACPPGVTFQQFRLQNGGVGCTSIEGLPMSTINTLKNIKNGCSCNVAVSGGTELGHATGGAFPHAPGSPVVDLSFNTALGDYLNANRQSLGIQGVCTTNADSQYRFNCNTPEAESHFHIVFSR